MVVILCVHCTAIVGNLAVLGLLTTLGLCLRTTLASLGWVGLGLRGTSAAWLIFFRFLGIKLICLKILDFFFWKADNGTIRPPRL